jgi:hypothetical protein
VPADDNEERQINGGGENSTQAQRMDPRRGGEDDWSPSRPPDESSQWRKSFEAHVRRRRKSPESGAEKVNNNEVMSNSKKEEPCWCRKLGPFRRVVTEYAPTLTPEQLYVMAEIIFKMDLPNNHEAWSEVLKMADNKRRAEAQTQSPE